jgi:hypothetical protein
MWSTFLTCYFQLKQISKLVLAIFFALTLQGCAESYSAKLTPQSNHGYSEVKKGLDTYLLSYEGTTRQSFELIEQYWMKRANELCPNGLEVLRKRQVKKHGSMRPPAAGTMITVGIWTPKVVGVIYCSKAHEIFGIRINLNNKVNKSLFGIG